MVEAGQRREMFGSVNSDLGVNRIGGSGFCLFLYRVSVEFSGVSLRNGSLSA